MGHTTIYFATVIAGAVNCVCCVEIDRDTRIDFACRKDLGPAHHFDFVVMFGAWRVLACGFFNEFAAEAASL